jgi:hypothetical protein
MNADSSDSNSMKQEDDHERTDFSRFTGIGASRRQKGRTQETGGKSQETRLISI